MFGPCYQGNALTENTDVNKKDELKYKLVFVICYCYAFTSTVMFRATSFITRKKCQSTPRDSDCEQITESSNQYLIFEKDKIQINVKQVFSMLPNLCFFEAIYIQTLLQKVVHGPEMVSKFQMVAIVSTLDGPFNLVSQYY